MLSFRRKTWLQWLMASNSGGYVHEWWRWDFLPPSSLLPFSSSFHGCCGNGRVDLRSLSPIFPQKLLNFSAHMTVSQGRVRAWKGKACMQAHATHTCTSRPRLLHTTHTETHTKTLSWEKSAIYLVSWPQCSVLFLYWLKEWRRETEDQGWERTIERALEKSVTFSCLVCVR